MSDQLTIDVPDGAFSCYVARPCTPGPHPVIVVLQEIFGVNAGIRCIAESYATKGYIAIAPDLFWRSEPGLSMSEDREGDWARGFALYSAYDVDKGLADIAATVARARTLPGASGKVGVTGYCLGGLLTYRVATRSRADAYVAYYGGATENHLADVGGIADPLLYHLAEEDEYIGKEAQAAIRAALEPIAGVELHRYPGCNHAFARPGGRHFDGPAAALANSRSDAFFQRHLS